MTSEEFRRNSLDRKNRQKLFLEDIEAYVSEHNGYVLNPTVASAPTDFMCDKGHEWQTSPRMMLLKKTWCPYCRKEERHAGTYFPVWKRFGKLDDASIGDKGFIITSESGYRLTFAFGKTEKKHIDQMWLKIEALIGQPVVVKGWERGKGARRNSQYFRDITLDDTVDLKSLPVRLRGDSPFIETLDQLKKKILTFNNRKIEEEVQQAQRALIATEQGKTLEELKQNLDKVNETLSVDVPDAERQELVVELKQLQEEIEKLSHHEMMEMEQLQLQHAQAMAAFERSAQTQQELMQQGLGSFASAQQVAEHKAEMEERLQSLKRQQWSIRENYNRRAGLLFNFREKTKDIETGLLSKNLDPPKFIRSMSGEFAESGDGESRYSKMTNRKGHKSLLGKIADQAEVKVTIPNTFTDADGKTHKLTKDQAVQIAKNLVDGVTDEYKELKEDRDALEEGFTRSTGLLTKVSKENDELKEQLSEAQSAISALENSSQEGISETEFLRMQVRAAEAEKALAQKENELLREKQRSSDMLKDAFSALTRTEEENEQVKYEMEQEQRNSEDHQQKEYDKDSAYFTKHYADYVGKSFQVRLRQNKHNHAKAELALRAGIDIRESLQIDTKIVKFEGKNTFTVVFEEFNKLTRVAFHHDGKDCYLKTVFNDKRGWVKAEKKVCGENGKRRTDVGIPQFLIWHEEIDKRCG